MSTMSHSQDTTQHDVYSSVRIFFPKEKYPLIDFLIEEHIYIITLSSPNSPRKIKCVTQLLIDVINLSKFIIFHVYDDDKFKR